MSNSTAKENQPTLELLQQLIACQSVTPSDGGCLDIISQRLAAYGFTCQRLDRGHVTNLWAYRLATNKNEKNNPLVCFAGHVDVVPSGPLEKWQSNPFQPTIRDGYLYGRGACDMKSGLAASIVAAENFLKQQQDTSLSLAFLITSDEEADAIDGTDYVVQILEEQGLQIDYCLIGEPTSSEALGDTVKNGRRGSLSGKLTINGLQGHIAYPHLCKNPINMFAPALQELCSHVWDNGNQYFGPTTWQISNIHAGTGAGNIIPGNLVVDFNFRFGTVSSAASLQEKFINILANNNLSSEDYTLTWNLSAQPFLTEAKSLISFAQQAFANVTSQTCHASTTGGTSDGRFLVRISKELLECGVVNRTAHKVNERVLASDPDLLAQVFQQILEKLDNSVK